MFDSLWFPTEVFFQASLGLWKCCPSLKSCYPAGLVQVSKHPTSQRAQILKNFKIALRDWNFQARLKRMTFSSEIENFKRATHQTPIFVGNSEGRDWKIQARLKFSSEIANFKRKLEIFKRSSEIDFFQDSGPLGCPKVLKEESAKSDLVSLGRESQKSLSHRANPVSHRAKQPKTQFRTVQENVLGLSLRRPKNTFRTLLKHFRAIWLFWHLCQASGVATKKGLSGSPPKKPLKCYCNPKT